MFAQTYKIDAIVCNEVFLSEELTASTVRGHMLGMHATESTTVFSRYMQMKIVDCVRLYADSILVREYNIGEEFLMFGNADGTYSQYPK